MRKLAALTFQTLDGVMQAPSVPEEDVSNHFQHGGWAQEYWQEAMDQVVPEAMSDPYDLLLGAKTYDIFAPHFSNAPSDNPVATMLNQATKYVVTSRDEPLTWINSVKVSGDIVEEVKSVKNVAGPLLQIHGSWQLIQLLQLHDLIDEYRLWTFPVVVGGGKKLFSIGSKPATFSLIRSSSLPNGVVMHIYRHNQPPSS